jgi:hypothetical protein
MGFNRRKMEDQRRQAADKEAAARRATDAQVLEDAERLIAAWNERQAIGAYDLCAHDRRRDYGRLLVSVGALPGQPDDQCNRSVDTRSSPRCRVDKPHSLALLPLMSAERAICEVSATLVNEHRRRNARGASAAGFASNDGRPFRSRPLRVFDSRFAQKTSLRIQVWGFQNILGSSNV